MENSGILIHCSETVLVDPKTLKFYDKNRNTHPREQIDVIKRLIKHHGFRKPLTVSNLSGMVVAGNGVLESILELGMTQVPVSFQDFADSSAEYTFHISDNAVKQWSNLDYALINLDLADIGPFDIEMLGIKDFKVDMSEIEILEPKDKNDPVLKDHDLKTCPNCGVSFG